MRRTALALLLMALLSLGIAQAQGTYLSPLLTLLATVPDTANNRTQFLYNDRAAIAAAYPPAHLPASFAEFALVADQDITAPADAVYGFDIFWGFNSSPMARYIALSEDMPGAVGFSFFDVDQELNYGTPPLQTISLTGDFDLDTVRAALSANSYQQVIGSAGELWCPEGDCSTGTVVDLLARNPANPFGGDLGRRFPIVIVGNTLIASPAQDVVTQHIDTLAEGQPTLADAPDYAAAALALMESGILLQAIFVDPTTLPAVESDGLPPYLLLAIGETTTPTTQDAQVALVYANEEDARRAVEALPGRLDTMSQRVQSSWRELLAERQVTDISARVVTRAAGLPVVLLTLRGARGTQEAIRAARESAQDTRDFVAPGDTFRLLSNAVFGQDTAWLAPEGAN